MEFEEGFSRDVRTIGHFGTGDLELSIRSGEDLEKSKPFILQSYEGS
jgi:predicted transport protein